MSTDHGLHLPLSTRSAPLSHTLHETSPGEHSQGRVVIVHPSRLFRDCLKKSLGNAVHHEVFDFAEVEEASELFAEQNVALLMISFAGAAVSSARLDAVLAQVGSGVPVVVCGESEDPRHVVELLGRGVRGYLPTSLDLEVTIHALGLVLAGGTFAPAASLMKLWQSTSSVAAKGSAPESLTSKQMAVIEAIRRGKPNKTIAYELNMCESTVKVHVRNIMKKLKAKNRTHVAFIANHMLGRDPGGLSGSAACGVENSEHGAESWREHEPKSL